MMVAERLSRHSMKQCRSKRTIKLTATGQKSCYRILKMFTSDVPWHFVAMFSDPLCACCRVLLDSRAIRFDPASLKSTIGYASF